MSTEERSIEIGHVPAGLGARERYLPCTQYRQGGRTQYDAVLTVAEVIETFKRPDHNQAVESNRKIDLKHAQEFAQYLLRNEDFGCPSIIGRVAPGVLRFDQVKKFEELSTAWGWLHYRFADMVMFVLVDGQHRVLGCWIAMETVSKRISDLNMLIQQSKSNGTEQVVIRKHEAELAKEKVKLERLRTQCITVEFVETDEHAGKRLFVDINDNVKSVRPDFRLYLDDRTAIGLIVGDVIENHPLLLGRVESGQEKGFSKTSKAFLGAKSVGDIARSVLAGPVGRISRRMDDELRQHQAAATGQVKKFLDLLVNYTDLRKLADNELEPEDLRYDPKEPDKPHSTMLASATMLRVLAGVYHDLITEDPKTKLAADGKPVMTRAEVGIFFRELGPTLRLVPVTEGSIWTRTGAFMPGSSAPTARHGDIGKLSRVLVEWAREGIPNREEVSAESAEPPSVED